MQQQQEKSKGYFNKKIKQFVGKIKDVPSHLDHITTNPFIVKGYRVNFNEKKQIFKSMFMIHNETTNIWTHFLGMLAVIVLMLYVANSYEFVDVKGFKNRVAQVIQGRIHPILNEFKELDDKINKNICYIQEKSYPDLYNNLIQIEQNIQSDFSDFKVSILEKIDSEQFDWVDIIFFFSKHDNLPSEHHEVSRWPIIIFLITAALCLFFSFFFHLSLCIDCLKTYKKLLRLDYAGVCLLIPGSTVPFCYYGFYCQLTYAFVHFTLIGIASAIVFIITLKDYIHRPENVKYKSMMYGGLGIFAGIPIIHLSLYEIFFKSENDFYSTGPSVIYYIFVAVSYLSGLYIYTVQFPEKLLPGQFDLCGASHQIWHISILFGIVLTYFGALLNFHTRVEYSCG